LRFAFGARQLIGALQEATFFSPSCLSISVSPHVRGENKGRTVSHNASFGLVLLRQVSVPAGEQHGGDGVGHDVGRLVGQELLDAHGRDGEAGAHLVPDLSRAVRSKQGKAAAADARAVVKTKICSTHVCVCVESTLLSVVRPSTQNDGKARKRSGLTERSTYHSNNSCSVDATRCC